MDAYIDESTGIQTILQMKWLAQRVQQERPDDGMSDEEALQLLASNGMLVKRPLLVVDGVPAAPGFKEAAWRQALGLPQEQ